MHPSLTCISSRCSRSPTRIAARGSKRQRAHAIRWRPRVGTARRLGAAWNYGQVSPVPRAAPGRRATVHTKTRQMFGEISGFLLDFTRLVGEDCADHGVPLMFAHRIAVPADQKNG